MSQYAQQWYNDTVELHTYVEYPDILGASVHWFGVPSFQPRTNESTTVASTNETGEEVARCFALSVEDSSELLLPAGFTARVLRN